MRESDRKPGSYVLSYLGRTGINHFRVTAVCGDFYIGGRQFDSLPDLIGYYTNVTDLLKKERLMHPVPPPEPVNDKKRIVAILPYTKMPDTDELRLRSRKGTTPLMGCKNVVLFKGAELRGEFPVANWDEILSSQNVINNVRLFF